MSFPSRWSCSDGSRRSSRAVLQDHAGRPGHVPLVRHDDPDLHAGPKQPLPYATRYEVTIDASATASADASSPSRTRSVHDADGQAAADRLVSPRRPLRQPVVILAPLQSARRPAHVARARLAPLPAARLVAARCRTRRRGVAADRSDGAPALRGQGRRHAAAARRRAPGHVSAGEDWDKKRFPPSPDLVVIRDRHAVPSGELGRLSSWTAQVPAIGGAGDAGRAAGLRRPGRTGVLHRRLRLHDDCNPERWNPLHLRRGVSSTDLRQGADRHRRHHPARGRAFARAGRAAARAHVRVGRATHFTLEDAGFAASRRRARMRLRVDAALQVERRADARLPLSRHRRELAPPGVHQLRRRPRRVGGERRLRCCRSTRATFARHAVGRAARRPTI